MACQNWISVLAEAGPGARAIMARRAKAPVMDVQTVVGPGMVVLLVGIGSTAIPTPVMLPEACLEGAAGS
jgi:hypothetical protein